MAPISIELRRSRDDPPAHDPEFQEELRVFALALRAAGLAYSQQGAVGYSLPQFLIEPSEIGPTFATLLLTWMQNQPGRSIRATVGEDAFDLESAEDVESLMERISQISRAETRTGEADS